VCTYTCIHICIYLHICIHIYVYIYIMYILYTSREMHDKESALSLCRRVLQCVAVYCIVLQCVLRYLKSFGTLHYSV